MGFGFRHKTWSFMGTMVSGLVCPSAVLHLVWHSTWEESNYPFAGSRDSGLYWSNITPQRPFQPSQLPSRTHLPYYWTSLLHCSDISLSWTYSGSLRCFKLPISPSNLHAHLLWLRFVQSCPSSYWWSHRSYRWYRLARNPKRHAHYGCRSSIPGVLAVPVCHIVFWICLEIENQEG